MDGREVLLSNGASMPGVMLGSFRIGKAARMDELIRSAFGGGCYGFDTSPSYGTEAPLGKALRRAACEYGLRRSRLFIADKIDGWQMYDGDIRKFVAASLRAMGLDYLDLLLVHWPHEKYLMRTWSRFETLYDEGIARAIGLCNVDERVFRRFLDGRIRIMPHVVQNEMSPLNPCVGDVDFFRRLGIAVEAYSPMCRMDPAVAQSEVLLEIARSHGKSIAQVILRWHRQRGIVPIFTSTRPERIRDNLALYDFSLSPAEMERVSALDRQYRIFPGSCGCPGY